jgi:hypothetical protein
MYDWFGDSSQDLSRKPRCANIRVTSGFTIRTYWTIPEVVQLVSNRKWRHFCWIVGRKLQSAISWILKATKIVIECFSVSTLLFCKYFKCRLAWVINTVTALRCARRKFPGLALSPRRRRYVHTKLVWTCVRGNKTNNILGPSFWRLEIIPNSIRSNEVNCWLISQCDRLYLISVVCFSSVSLATGKHNAHTTDLVCCDTTPIFAGFLFSC